LLHLSPSSTAAATHPCAPFSPQRRQLAFLAIVGLQAAFLYWFTHFVVYLPTAASPLPDASAGVAAAAPVVGMSSTP